MIMNLVRLFIVSRWVRSWKSEAISNIQHLAYDFQLFQDFTNNYQPLTNPNDEGIDH